MATLSAQEFEELAYEDNTPTPAGWRRKLIPYIGRGLIPARTDVIFAAPSGEEFRSKAQLQRYLKKNKGSPSISEFIWSTDETPRRSSRSASRRSKSPPKTMSKKKPAPEVPLQEAKATKRGRPEKESVDEKALREEKKRPITKQASNASPNEGTEDTNGEATPKGMNGGLTTSSPSSKAKEENKKHMKDTKKKKSVKAEAKPIKISSKIIESTHNARTSENEEEEEKLESNGKEAVMKENGKEEALEEPVSLLVVEEKDAETQKMQSENEDVGDDRTTTSLLGSDFSAEGREADSDSFESDGGGDLHEEEVNRAQAEEHANAPEGS